jgi:hypothetical protein
MSHIVVQHYQFPIRDPFETGHVMTAIEAHVLNWHRARLIQKIIKPWVLDVLVKNGSAILSVEELNKLSQRIEEFDKNYTLSPAKEPKTSVLEYNLNMLAENFLRHNGGSTDLRPEDIERIKKTPEIQARARELIQSSTFALEELMA